MSDSDEDDFDEIGKSYAERIVYAIDAGLDEARFEQAMGFVFWEYRQRIRSKSRDKVGLVVYGDGGSCRAVPALPLAKCDAPAARILAGRRGSPVTEWLDSMSASVLDRIEKLDTSLQSAVYAAESMLEKSRDGSGLKVFKSIMIVTDDLEPSSDVDRLARFANDCSDRQVELRVALFGLDGQSDILSRFWKPVLEASRNSDKISWRDLVSCAEDVLDERHQNRHRLSLRSTVTTHLFVGTAKIPINLVKNFRIRSKPTSTWIYKKTGDAVKEVREIHDDMMGSRLEPYDIRKYYRVGGVGRAYIEDDEKNAAQNVLGGDGREGREQRVEIVGFLDVRELPFDESLLGTCGIPEYMVPSDDEGAALDALYSAMLHSHKHALAWRIQPTKTTLVVLRPVREEGTIVLFDLPFAGETRRAVLSNDSPPPPRDAELDGASQDLVDHLFSTEDNYLPSLVNPSLAKFYAVLESSALDLGRDEVDAAKLISAKQLPESSPRLDAITIAFNDALDSLAPLPEPSAALKGKRTKAQRDEIPDSLFETLREESRGEWENRVETDYNLSALKEACDTFQLKKTGTKRVLVQRIAEHVLNK